MHIEAHLLGPRAPGLVAETVRVLPVGRRVEAVVPRRHALPVDLVPPPAAVVVLVLGGPRDPKVQLQVARAPEFPVPDLERHRHLVAFVQVLVEAFARVRAQLDVVRLGYGGPEGGGGEGCYEGGEEGAHPVRSWWAWGWVGEVG